MFDFNERETSDRKSKAKLPSLGECLGLVEILNQHVCDNVSDGDRELVQQFLDCYQNMEYYVNCTSGLLATEHKLPDDLIDSHDFFKLEF